MQTHENTGRLEQWQGWKILLHLIKSLVDIHREINRGSCGNMILKLINNSWRYKPTRVPNLGQVDEFETQWNTSWKSLVFYHVFITMITSDKIVLTLHILRSLSLMRIFNTQWLGETFQIANCHLKLKFTIHFLKSSKYTGMVAISTFLETFSLKVYLWQNSISRNWY